MEEITPKQLREWRQNAAMTQEALGKQLGLTKIAITKIEGGQRQISDPEQKLLKLLIHGELPFHNAAIEEKNTRLEFSPKQWEVIQATAQREGYSNAKLWIVDKIKSYLRMNPQSAPLQVAAEAPGPYHKSDKK